MRTGKGTFEADMERVTAAEFIPWERLRGKTILVTGATGLIGFTLVSALLCASRRYGLDLTVLALTRDAVRARTRFAGQLQNTSTLRLIEGDVCDIPEIAHPIDYIVHGAGPTSSKAFVKQPVETLQTMLEGTMNVLELAREKQVSGLVYLSSMEVYGYPQKGHKVTEEEAGRLLPQVVRNSYPIGKLQCESLCCAYASEYGLPVMISRLTQTFGPGISYGDGRVFAEFARCVKEKRDIILKTKGETERSYLYTADATAAILTILLKGRPGQAYNTADESTYCSIAGMAQALAQANGIKVCFDLESGDNILPDLAGGLLGHGGVHLRGQEHRLPPESGYLPPAG